MNKFFELFIATTDTVVGIGAPVSDKNKELIYEIKKRPKNKKLVIMISSLQMAKKVAQNEWNDELEILANKVWPGNTTLVINEKLSLRIPDKPKLLKLIDKLGPIYMTSANISGEETYSFDQAKKVFDKLIDTFFNFGLGSGKASTIIDVKTKKILRR